MLKEPCAMNRMFRFAFVVLGAMTFSAPVLAAENWPDSFGAYVAQVRTTIKTTDMEGYLAVLKNPAGAVLIDIREENEYKAGHIPGTVHIPRGLLEFQIWKQLGHPKPVDMAAKIYVQCRTGGRATLAAASLKQLGFTNVTAVVMNIEDWEKKSYPYVK
jgi:rhodanese-related sulfurtransferase